MSATIQLNYGNTQQLVSNRMSKYPFLSRCVNRLFGCTNTGNYARSKVFRKQVKRLPLAEMQTVLDLGCGYGEYAIMMAQGLKQARVFALDIDKDALRNFRAAQQQLQLSNLEIREGTIDTLQEREFDFIYSVDVFEHIPENEMPFRQAFSKLKKGGILLVKMPHVTQRTVFPAAWFSEHQDWVDHEHPGQVYSLEELEHRFRVEGFRILFSARTDGYCARLAWEISYLMKRKGAFFQLLSLPLCKLLVNLDLLLHANNSNRGNAITVTGIKL